MGLANDHASAPYSRFGFEVHKLMCQLYIAKEILCGFAMSIRVEKRRRAKIRERGTVVIRNGPRGAIAIVIEEPGSPIRDI